MTKIELQNEIETLIRERDKALELLKEAQRNIDSLRIKNKNLMHSLTYNQMVNI